MWEMIVCVAVAWGGACQEQRPVYYPSKVFCERAIPAAKAVNPKITSIYSPSSSEIEFVFNQEAQKTGVKSAGLKVA